VARAAARPGTRWRRKTVWEHETSEGIRGYDGGVMSTAGKPGVPGGAAAAKLWVYAADTGKGAEGDQKPEAISWRHPMTYSVNGEQFVAIQAGYGGRRDYGGPHPAEQCRSQVSETTNRIIAFKLGGGAVPTPAPRVEEALLRNPPIENRKQGRDRRGRDQIRGRMFALPCAGGRAARQTSASSTPACMPRFKDIVLEGGARAPAGMERFDDILSEKDVDHIHAYLIDQSWVAYRDQEAAAGHVSGGGCAHRGRDGAHRGRSGAQINARPPCRRRGYRRGCGAGSGPRSI